MAQANNLVVGKGRVFFDMFAPGTKTKTGERYLGNTPSFSMTNSPTSLDHYSAEGGIAVKDAAVLTQMNRSGKFQTDNIDVDNVGLFFSSDGATKQTQIVKVGLTDTITAKLGRYYQLGVTAATPAGLTNLTNIVVKKGAATIAPTGNLAVDPILGRIYIEPTAAGVTAADVLTITYDTQAYSRDLIVSKNQSVYGALRFVADNPVGDNKDYYMPYVQLSPEGDFALKGDKWQEIAFKLDILMLDSNTQSLYVTGR